MTGACCWSRMAVRGCYDLMAANFIVFICHPPPLPPPPTPPPRTIRRDRIDYSLSISLKTSGVAFWRWCMALSRCEIVFVAAVCFLVPLSLFYYPHYWLSVCGGCFKRQEERLLCLWSRPDFTHARVCRAYSLHPSPQQRQCSFSFCSLSPSPPHRSP